MNSQIFVIISLNFEKKLLIFSIHMYSLKICTRDKPNRLSVMVFLTYLETIF